MKTRGFIRTGGCVLLVLLTLINIAAQRKDGPTEMEERLTAPLLNAGIELNAPSIIKALKHSDLLVASRAALLLPRYPKTRSMVKALNEAVEDRREVVAVTAARALLKLNETEWAATALKRLPTMRDRVAQLQLAGLLAQAGRGDGWPLVVSAIADEGLALIALEDVSYFDQLKGPDGKHISVIGELTKLLQTTSGESRQRITEKLKQLKAPAH